MHQALIDTSHPRYDREAELAFLAADRATKLDDLRTNLAIVRSSRRGKLGSYGKSQLAAIARIQLEIAELEGGPVEAGNAMTPAGRTRLGVLLDNPATSCALRRLVKAILRREEMRFTDTEGRRLGLLPPEAA